MSAEDFQTYKTTVTSIGGDVYVSLPDDGYMQMPPEKARKLATALFIKANEAEGKEAPEVVVFK